jgi:hypothetical protein
MGSALRCSGEIVRMRPAIRRVPHARHLYKYLDMPLPPGKRFSFKTEKGHLGIEAASLYELSRLIQPLPLGSLEYHDRREDFVKWADWTLDDGGRRTSLKNGESPLSGRGNPRGARPS